jgi:decaprenyl-phosphate phosphoribosyltransferase
LSIDQVSAAQEARAVVVARVLASTPRPPASVGDFLRAARPKQWVKNLLVFAAPGAAGVLTHGDVLARSVIAFAVFCVAASGNYFLNDVVDRDHDRRDRFKRLRPVASGTIGARVAVATAVVLLATALLGGLVALGPAFGAAVALYVAVNVAYNLRLRREPILDLAAVASGFVIRAVAGGLATGVPLSEWFLVVISFSSLFVVAGKREATLAVPFVDDTTRRIDYPPGFLRYVRLLASGIAIIAYCLWAFEKAAGAGSAVWFQLTIVPFVLAILRYALLVENGEGEAPEDVLLGDATVLVLVGAWAAVFAIGVYGA